MPTHEHTAARDYPLPAIGATGTEQWGPGEWLSESHHDFEVLRHYAEQHDVRDFSGATHERLPQWRTCMVTACRYTCDCHHGSIFYLWRGRWNTVTLHTNR